MGVRGGLWFAGVAAAMWVFVAAAPEARGGGFQVGDQGARATGQGGAFAAQADDATAIYYNPAGLVQLRGTHLALGSDFYFPDTRFRGDDGSREGNDLAAVIPHFYLVSDFGTERWRFGLGVNNVHGLAVDWGNRGDSGSWFRRAI